MNYDADGNFVSWPKLGEDDDEIMLCREDSQCKEAFPDYEATAVCGTTWDQFGLDPIDHDGIRDIELIMYGIPGFDNVGQGFLTIFQILTLESWVYLMYNFSDAGSPTISVIFFVLVVLLGAFFTMNLVLAIIVDSFDQDDENEDDEEEKEKQDKEMFEKMQQEPSFDAVRRSQDLVKITESNLPDDKKIQLD